MHGRYGVLLAIALNLAPAAHAGVPVAMSEYTSLSWAETEGLPASQIWAIAQDQDGYLWLGTNSSLVRFDGVRFVTWNELHGSALVNASVRSLFVSRDGSLWVGYGGRGGVARIRGAEIVTYRQKDGIHNGEVSAFWEDAGGTLWMGQGDGLSRFRSDHWEPFELEHGVPQSGVDSLFADRAGNLWVATPRGIYRRDAGQERFHSVTKRHVRAFAEGAGGAIFATGADGFGRLDAPDRSVGAEPRRTLTGTRLLFDRRGQIWLGSFGRGLARVNLADEAQPVEYFSGKGALSSDVVRCLLEDREGNIWVGTQRGLNRLSRTIVTPIPAVGDQEMNRHVRAVTRGKDGALWVGTGDGLYRFFNKEWTRFDRRQGLPSAQITALHADADGTMWIATQEGVARLKDEHIAAAPELAALQVHSMTTDHRGDLWLNDAQNGLFRWHRHDRSVERIAEVEAPFSAYTDKDGRVWIGTFTGTVYVFDDRTSRSYAESDGLSGGSITSLFQDRNGAMWVGSVGGLSRFLTDHFVTLTERHGMPGSIVEAIIDDDKGCLWLGLNSGIARIPTRELEQAISSPAHHIEHSLYDSSDGLRGTPIGLGQPIVTRTSDDSLWFTTSDGLASIDPSHADRNRLPPPIHIESVLADGRPLVQNGDLGLPARTANVQIDYTALSYVAPSQIRFRYMLEGFDADWVDAGTRRRAFYTNLPPRRYRFRVAANNGGVWSQADAQQDFFIRPTVYQRPAFFALCVAAGIVLIALAWQTRVRQVRRSFALVLSERTRMAREIHDTVLQSLVGLALQLDAAARDLDGSSQTAKRHFERLRREVQVNIRETRQSILDLRSPMFERKDLALALPEIGRRIAKGKAQFTFVLTGVPRSASPKIEEQLLRIGQEAITNAARHARANQITVELEFGEDKVVLRVIDDGVGFDLSNVADQFESHWGLANMQERTQLIGGEFRVITAPGRGTEIQAVGPL